MTDPATDNTTLASEVDRTSQQLNRCAIVSISEYHPLMMEQSALLYQLELAHKLEKIEHPFEKDASSSNDVSSFTTSLLQKYNNDVKSTLLAAGVPDTDHAYYQEIATNNKLLEVSLISLFWCSLKLAYLCEQSFMRLPTERNQHLAILKVLLGLKDLRFYYEALCRYPDVDKLFKCLLKQNTETENQTHVASSSSLFTVKRFKFAWHHFNNFRLFMVRIIKVIICSNDKAIPKNQPFTGFASYLTYYLRLIYNLPIFLRDCFFLTKNIYYSQSPAESKQHWAIFQHRKNRRVIEICNDVGWSVSNLLIVLGVLAPQFLAVIYTIDIGFSLWRYHLEHEKHFLAKKSIEKRIAIIAQSTNKLPYHEEATLRHRKSVLEANLAALEAQWQVTRFNLHRSLVVNSAFTVAMFVVCFGLAMGAGPFGVLAAACVVLLVCALDSYLQIFTIPRMRNKVGSSLKSIDTFSKRLHATPSLSQSLSKSPPQTPSDDPAPSSAQPKRPPMPERKQVRVQSAVNFKNLLLRAKHAQKKRQRNTWTPGEFCQDEKFKNEFCEKYNQEHQDLYEEKKISANNRHRI